MFLVSCKSVPSISLNVISDNTNSVIITITKIILSNMVANVRKFL